MFIFLGHQQLHKKNFWLYTFPSLKHLIQRLPHPSILSWSHPAIPDISCSPWSASLWQPPQSHISCGLTSIPLPIWPRLFKQPILAERQVQADPRPWSFCAQSRLPSQFPPDQSIHVWVWGSMQSQWLPAILHWWSLQPHGTCLQE